MKILRTREEAQKQKISREKANEGCYVCPSCGCDKVIDIFDSMETQEKGIVRVTFNTSEKGFFKTKYGVVDHYECKHCGTVWESEVY